MKGGSAPYPTFSGLLTKLSLLWATDATKVSRDLLGVRPGRLPTGGASAIFSSLPWL